MIEVFKTSVKEITESKQLLKVLKRKFPNAKINFDLEDCDNILRIESPREINVQIVNSTLKQFGHHLEILK